MSTMSEKIFNAVDYRLLENIDEKKNNIIINRGYDILDNNNVCILDDQSNVIIDDQSNVVMTEQENTVINEKESNTMNKQESSVINESESNIVNESESDVLNESESDVLNESESVVLNVRENNVINERETFIQFLNSNDIRFKKIQHDNEIYYYARNIFNYFTSISNKTCIHFALNTVSRCNKFTIKQLKAKHNNMLLDNNQNVKQFIQFDDTEYYLNKQGLYEFLNFLHNIEPKQFKKRLSLNFLPTVIENND
ncbi:putative Bro-N domain-containing protein [Yalta virus]|nr:putative Bro-N domain-containing protein [Yalta virus]